MGWTLNFEMFFYGLLALSLLISPGRALLLAMLVVLILPVLKAVGLNAGPIAGSFLLYEFAFGLLIFLLFVKLGQIHQRPVALQIGLGSGFLLIALASFKLQFYRADMVIASTLVMGCVCGEAVFRSLPKLMTSVFVHLGDLSYSTYLLHVPAMIFVGVWVDRSRDNDFVLILTTVAVTYVMSAVSYTVIEQRLSKALKRLLKQKRCTA